MSRISVRFECVAEIIGLTDAEKGPPDHRVSRFRVSVSAPGGPIGIAPRRPLPSGYVVRMMSLTFAGVVDHSDFAVEGLMNVKRRGSRQSMRDIVQLKPMLWSALEHHSRVGGIVLLHVC
jgi:hypothetical protein